MTKTSLDCFKLIQHSLNYQACARVARGARGACSALGAAAEKSPSETSSEISETSASEASSAPAQGAGAAAEGGWGVAEGARAAGVPETCRGCLAQEPSTPAWLAASYPLLLVSCIFLFLYADLAVGAVVSATLEARGEANVFDDVFTFSLISTIEHSWKAGAYLIAILTLLASAIWPFAKLLLLFALWLAPARRLGLGARGRILGILDAAGKYSFFDSWFLVLTISAFSLTWRSGDAELRVQVRPTTPFYCFVVATAMSLVLGHVASEYHRYSLRVERRGPEGKAKASYCYYYYYY